LDNTWGAGLAFNPFDLLRVGTSQDDNPPLGVDITIHALTKYPSGGGDVLMGSIVTRSDELARKLKLTHMRLGTGVGGNDAEAVLRSLPSLVLRYQAQDMAARELAQWCQQQAVFTQVLHPALDGAPGHEHWRALCVHEAAPEGMAAGIFSVVVDERVSQQKIDQFCDHLTLFKIGYSWGGPMSLVMPYQLKDSRDGALSPLAKARVIRFCIGLERVSDLKADLQKAMYCFD
jgi:cystathionine beta-lyase